MRSRAPMRYQARQDKLCAGADRATRGRPGRPPCRRCRRAAGTAHAPHAPRHPTTSSGHRHARIPRTLRLLPDHRTRRLHVARRQASRRLHRGEHRGIPLRARQGRGDRASRSGDKSQRLLVARLWKPGRHLAAAVALRRARPTDRGADEHRDLRTLPADPRGASPPRRRDPRPRRHQQRRAGRTLRGRRAQAHR